MCYLLRGIFFEIRPFAFRPAIMKILSPCHQILKNRVKDGQCILFIGFDKTNKIGKLCTHLVVNKKAHKYKLLKATN